jgi:Fe(3+) dicitrate transport protein
MFFALSFALGFFVTANEGATALVPQLPDAGMPAIEAPADAGMSLHTVVVGTPDYRTAGSMYSINGARLKRFELDDPHAVLQAVPGVQVRGEDGFGLRPNIGLRGANPDRSKKVTLMEDGVLFGPAPYSAPAAYYFPLITRMETVRIIKGAGSIMYGPQTIGGAIDLVTRDFGPGISAGLDAAMGQYWYGKAHGYFSAANDTSGFLLEGVHLRSDGFKTIDVVGGNTGFDRTELMGKARHRISVGQARHEFLLKLGYSGERSNETYLGLTDADFRAAPLRRYTSSALDLMTWHRTQVSLTHRLEAGTWSLTTTAYRNDLGRTWTKMNRFRDGAVADVLSTPGSARNAVFTSVLRGESDSSSDGETLLVGPNQRAFVAQGVESVYRNTAETGPLHHAFEARVRYHFDSITRNHTEDAFLMRSGRLVNAGEATAVLVRNEDATHAVALSASDAISWGRLTLTPGLRVEIINSHSFDMLSSTKQWGSANVFLPGLGAYVSATEHLGFFAGAYRGFSPPQPGTTALPELSLNAEAGARWTRPNERLEAIGFFNNYSNLTDICTFSNGCLNENVDQQFNLGAAHIYGVEVFAEKRFKVGPATFPLAATYTFTRTQLLTSAQTQGPSYGNFQQGDELAYVPMHLFNASVGVDVWRLGLHAQFTYIDRMREIAGQGEWVPGKSTDAQFVADVHLGFRICDWAQVYFDVRNVLNQHAIVGRLPFGARPNAPRTFIGGLKLTY